MCISDDDAIAILNAVGVLNALAKKLPTQPERTGAWTALLGISAVFHVEPLGLGEVDARD